MIYFDLEELVCPHVFKKYGEVAWSFFDHRLLETMDLIRQKIGRPIFVNDWKDGPTVYFDERGFRCIQCDLVKKAIADNTLYVSAHMTGQGFDFNCEGMVAEEVRQWIIKNQNLLPYSIRLEAGTSWIHLDMRNMTDKKVTLFNK